MIKQQSGCNNKQIKMHLNINHQLVCSLNGKMPHFATKTRIYGKKIVNWLLFFFYMLQPADKGQRLTMTLPLMSFGTLDGQKAYQSRVWISELGHV